MNRFSLSESFTLFKQAAVSKLSSSALWCGNSSGLTPSSKAAAESPICCEDEAEGIKDAKRIADNWQIGYDRVI